MEKVDQIFNELLNIKIYEVKIATESWDYTMLFTTNLQTAKKEFDGINYSDFDNQTDPTNCSMLEEFGIDKEKVKERFEHHKSEIDVENIETEQEYIDELIYALEYTKNDIEDNSEDFIDVNSSAETLDYNKFGDINDTIYTLLDELEDNLGKDLQDDDFHGYKITHFGQGRKYSIIEVIDSNGEVFKRIQLRISNHTYNPANNSYEDIDDFISVEVANFNPTKERFYRAGKSLEFNENDGYELILNVVRERLEDIILGVAYSGSQLDENQQRRMICKILNKNLKKIFDLN